MRRQRGRLRKYERQERNQREVNDLFAEYNEKLKNNTSVSWSAFDARLKSICSSVGDYQQAKSYAKSAGFRYPEVFEQYRAAGYDCAEYQGF